MKKVVKIIGYCLLIIISIFVNVRVDATAGRLRKSSIITCSGVMYGQHGDGHWHKAVKRGSYYYPNGSPVTPPCLNSNGGSSSKNNSSSTNKTPTRKANLNIKSIKINDEDITNIRDTMEYATYEDSITIDVVPAGEEAEVTVKGDLNNLEINKTNKIQITIEDLGKTKTYNLNITRKVNLDNEDINLKINNEPVNLKTSEDLVVTNKTINFDYLYPDDISVKVYKNNEELVDNTDTIDGSTSYQIILSTKDNQTKTYNLSIKYQEPEVDNPNENIDASKEETTNNQTTSNEDNSGLGTGIITVGGLGALGYYLVKKRK